VLTQGETALTVVVKVMNVKKVVVVVVVVVVVALGCESSTRS
jgi:hypothetical protein